VRVTNDSLEGFEARFVRLLIKCHDLIVTIVATPFYAVIDELPDLNEFRVPVLIGDKCWLIVGNAHNHDAIVAEFAQIKIIPDADTKRRDQRLDFVGIENAVQARTLGIQIAWK
jgi:hypothetical protein